MSDLKLKEKAEILASPENPEHIVTAQKLAEEELPAFDEMGRKIHYVYV